MKETATISQNVSDRIGTAIELRNVTKRFRTPTGQAYTALRDLNLSVAPGEFCAVVGPTGCGKSTTLGLICGLERPSAGVVQVMGKPVQGIDPRIGYVFQSDAVFPWKNVLRNVATGPLYRGQRKAEALDQARDWIARVGLAGFEDRYPHQLSGGMRKRMALAQTFINGPQILLMDEPFSALDVQTRTMMEDELLQLWSAASASVVFVTHDLEEAISLADRVCVITAGPGTVKGISTVDLPRPRKVAEIRFEPRFVDIYQQIWEDLRNTEFALLKQLVANAGKVLTHRMLLQSIWGPEYGGEAEYLRVYINRLRHKLEPDSAIPRYLLTEPGVGYRFVTPESEGARRYPPAEHTSSD